MKYPSERTLEQIRRRYPAGCRVRLVRMDDVQAPPVGTLGTVIAVDDMGDVLIKWDNVLITKLIVNTVSKLNCTHN